MKNKLLMCTIYIMLITFYSCTKNESNIQNIDLNFNTNKLYMQNISPGTNDCWTNLILTDGSLTENSTNYIPSNDMKNIIFFHDLKLSNCELTAKEWVWDTSILNDPNQGMEGVNLIVNMTINNGIRSGGEDLTNNISYSKVKFTPPNNFQYIIKLTDGRIVQNSYTGVFLPKERSKSIKWN